MIESMSLHAYLTESFSQSTAVKIACFTNHSRTAAHPISVASGMLLRNCLPEMWIVSQKVLEDINHHGIFRKRSDALMIGGFAGQKLFFLS